MLIVLTMANLFYVISGILFWASDYFKDVLHEKQGTVTLCFAVTALTAPILGALCSAPVLGWAGGFSSPYAQPVCLFLSVLA